MSERLFIELANLNHITPEWVEEKQGFGFRSAPYEAQVKSIKAGQREVRNSLFRLVNGKEPDNFCLRVITGLSDPFRFRISYPLEIVSEVATRAAKDFLHFFETDKGRVRQCKDLRCKKFFLYEKTANQEYCSEKCRSKFRELKNVVSGKAARKQKAYRKSLQEQPEVIELPGNRYLVQAKEGQGGRDINCPYYSDCITEAGRRRWPDFSCKDCPQNPKNQ